MSFPFSAKLESDINFDASTSSKDVLLFVKDIVIEQSYKAAQDFQLNNSELHYRVHFWKTGKASDVDGIRKGVFCFENGKYIPRLTHVYYIGGSFIYVTVLFAVFIAIALVTSTIKMNQLLFGLLIYCLLFIVLWLASLFKQNRNFKEIVSQIEIKWKAIT